MEMIDPNLLGECIDRITEYFESYFNKSKNEAADTRTEAESNDVPCAGETDKAGDHN